MPVQTVPLQPKSGHGLAGPARGHRLRGALLAAGAAMLAACTATASPPAPRPVASLGIGNLPPAAHLVTLPARQARVRAEQRFAVVVATSDGPYAWILSAAGAPRVVARAGTGPAGSCPGDEPGCAPPQRYTFRARAAGTTMITFTLYSLRCGLHPQPSQASCRLDIQDIRLTVS